MTSWPPASRPGQQQVLATVRHRQAGDLRHDPPMEARVPGARDQAEHSGVVDLAGGNAGPMGGASPPPVYSVVARAPVAEEAAAHGGVGQVANEQPPPGARSSARRPGRRRRSPPRRRTAGRCRRAPRRAPRPLGELIATSGKRPGLPGPGPSAWWSSISGQSTNTSWWSRSAHGRGALRQRAAPRPMSTTIEPSSPSAGSFGWMSSRIAPSGPSR